MIPKDRPIGTRLGEFQMRTRREKKKASRNCFTLSLDRSFESRHVG